MSAPRVVCVTWMDAHGNAYATYEPHEIPHQPAIVRTFGVLLREDDTGVSIANELFETGGIRGVTFIPKGMIREIVDVKRNGKKRQRPHDDSGTDGAGVRGTPRHDQT